MSYIKQMDSSPSRQLLSRDEELPGQKSESLAPQFTAKDFEGIFLIREVRETDTFLSPAEKERQQRFQKEIDALKRFFDDAQNEAEKLNRESVDKLTTFDRNASTGSQAHRMYGQEFSAFLPDSKDYTDVLMAVNDTSTSADQHLAFSHVYDDKPLTQTDINALRSAGISEKELMLLVDGHKPNEAVPEFSGILGAFRLWREKNKKETPKKIKREVLDTLQRRSAKKTENFAHAMYVLGRAVADIRVGSELPGEPELTRLQLELPALLTQLQKIDTAVLTPENQNALRIVKERCSSRIADLQQARKTEQYRAESRIQNTWSKTLDRVSWQLENFSQNLTQENVQRCRDLILSVQKSVQENEVNALTPPAEAFEKDKSETLARIEKLQEKLRQAKFSHLEIGDPRDIRKRILIEYQDKVKSSSEREARLWLKEAMQLAKEFARNQAEAFLHGYDDAWKYLVQAGEREIPEDATPILQAFKESGLAFNASTMLLKQNFEEIIKSHNTVLKVLKKTEQTRFGRDIVDRTPEEIFEAVTGVAPTGVVRLNKRTPLLAIRLYCENDEDYLRLEDPTLAKHDMNRVTDEAGRSYNFLKKFSFADGTEVQAPLISLRGEHGNDNYHKTITHEDSHRHMFVDAAEAKDLYEGNESISKLPKAFKGPEIVQKIGEISAQNWRDSLNYQLQQAFLTAGDEVQAYLSEGTEPQAIYDILTTSDLYSYIGSDNWKQLYLDAFAGKPNEQQLKDQFLADVQKTQGMYEQKLKSYLFTVEKILELFENQSQGKEKLAVILRYFAPNEWMHLYRLARETKA